MSDNSAMRQRQAGLENRGEAWRTWARVLAFGAAYVFLDWASYIHPTRELNITPWNPAPALGLLFLLRAGGGGAKSLFSAILMAELLVRDAVGHLVVAIALSALLTAGYGVMAAVLRRRFPDDGLFVDRDGLLAWTLIVLAGSLLNSLVFISALVVGGMISFDEWALAVLRFWVGDGVGIFVTMPVFWWLAEPRRRQLFRAAVLQWSTVGYLMLAVLTLWIAFDLGASANFRYFYVLFLPLVWASSRQGMAGAVLCALSLQLGMLVAGQWQATLEVSVFELQMRALMLALVGFLIGISVDDQRRATSELRQSLRLAAAGEMAAALAHELNQPLTALSAYGSACERLLTEEPGGKRLRETIRRMVGEAVRAAEVVRRLRDFFRSGSTRIERVAAEKLIAVVAGPFVIKARREEVDFVIAPCPAVYLLVDCLQMEVVLRNLLTNAFEAVQARRGGERRVSLRTDTEGTTLIIRVQDNGTGIVDNMRDRLFEPFASSKANGLGLGLAISRAIAEAHGGTLVVEGGKHGSFRLELPMDERGEATDG
jgi:two-component system, LuxR family, sensor kinase FixL